MDYTVRRHQETSAVRRKLCESDLYVKIAVKNKKNVKRFQWTKAHKSGQSRSRIKSLDWQIKVQNLLVQLEDLCEVKSWWKSCNSLYHSNCKAWWRSFTNCKVGNLHLMKGKFNQTGYHSILQHHTIPSRMWLVGCQGFVLMQDNDPKHTRKLGQRYIKSKEEQHVLQLMPWPAQLIKSHWTGVGGTCTKSHIWTTQNCGSILATLAEKLTRTIFSLPLVFGIKNAKNTWSSY